MSGSAYREWVYGFTGVVEVPGESGREEGDRGAACGGDHRISGVVVTSYQAQPSRHAQLRPGIPPVVLVSIHVDAAGSDGQWHNASGWSCYTSPGQTRGDELATCLYHAAEKYLAGRKIRTDYSDGDPDKEAGFFILNHTKCPAALVECGFMDNRAELEYLQSPEGRKAMVGVVVEGVVEFLS